MAEMSASIIDAKACISILDVIVVVNKPARPNEQIVELRESTSCVLLLLYIFQRIVD